MPIEKHDTFPRLRWWQRAIRRLSGGHDLVAVVAAHHFHDGRTLTATQWLTGVDVRQPIAVDIGEGVTVAIVLPDTQP